MIRLASNPDFATLGQVMFDAVRNGPSKYNQAQRKAWVPAPRRCEKWQKKLATQDVVLQELAGEITGFLSLRNDGYIDLAFIRPAHQGTGVFRRLYSQLENRAAEKGINRLWVHASLMAQPAFRAVNFDLVMHQEVKVGDQIFKRAQMEKRIY